ncbi:ATP-binding cassette sub-family G member 1-like isoform X1 [Anopheles sinensis]|uniref:ATP-binding cassette sub-family G member 1-like isoform X1 n=1 Tax=Anopheles sinensis TaxID=74873 RepID=A0A084WRA1_ANOSI|nr:ATP-binding cassette sub-family G member 1-like isoform X1 [Anopheles sinensis]
MCWKKLTGAFNGPCSQKCLLLRAVQCFEFAHNCSRICTCTCKPGAVKQCKRGRRYSFPFYYLYSLFTIDPMQPPLKGRKPSGTNETTHGGRTASPVNARFIAQGSQIIHPGEIKDRPRQIAQEAADDLCACGCSARVGPKPATRSQLLVLNAAGLLTFPCD